MAIDTAQFKGLFLSEAEDNIQKLNDNLLLLEKYIKGQEKTVSDIPSKQELLDELMRSSHTVKGSSATMGYQKTAFLTHVMEDIFDFSRNNMLEITPDIIDVLFETIDKLELSILSVKENDKEITLTNIAQKLKDITGVKTSGVGRSKRSEDGKPITVSNKKQEANSNTNVQKAIPEKFVEDYKLINPRLTQEKSVKMAHIKVPVKRLDILFDLVEELLIDKMRLQEILNRETVSFIGLSDQEIDKRFPLYKKFSPVVEHISGLVSSIQHQVMKTRLVPLGQIFARFPRLIRDISKKQGKTIEFKIIGSDLELDRSIVDTLGEPLIHLIKNAVDHGIEKEGTITLSAKRKKNVTTISIEDTGVGINWLDVVEAAMHRKIIQASDRDAYMQKIRTGRVAKEGGKSGLSDIEKLIFHPRLSTNVQVTETSGRGVGLSVVEQFARNSNGSISVHSPRKEGGTKFSLELPLSLAITKALMVGVGNKKFAIPFSAIEHSVNISDSHIKSMGDQDVAVISGREVPLVHLSTIFGIARTPMRRHNSSQDVVEEVGIKAPAKKGKKQKKVKKDKGERTTAVLVRHGDAIAGLVIDSLHDEQEIIVKSLPPVLKGLKGFSGSTILGDGKAILILDIPTILEDHSKFLRVI